MSGAEFARYARDLTRAAASIDSLADLAAFRTAKAALDTARTIAPEDQGDLIREMRLVKRRDGWAVESPNVAAMFQELGTSQMAPNPYMGPAAIKHTPQLVREVERIADNIAKELG